MQTSFCMNCMRQTRVNPCPHCGHRAAAPEEQSLEGIILNGRYLTGRMQSRSGFERVYVGLDLATERKVRIQEFFPDGQARRDPDSDAGLIWLEPEGSGVLRQAGIRTFLSQAGVEPVLDSFEENATAYIIRPWSEPLPIEVSPVEELLPEEDEEPEDDAVLPFLAAAMIVILIIGFTCIFHFF